ncbi:MAG: neutral zinc metallopeptidase [Chromatiales bacterium]
MRWRSGRRSTNIEDRRSSGPAGMRFPFPSGGGGKRGGGISLGSIVVILVLMFVFDINPLELLGGGGTLAPTSYEQGAEPQGSGGQADDDEMKAFVSVVLGDTEDTWHAVFNELGATYKEPRLVLFRGAVQSACGFAQAAMGPFYCPGDQKVYLDLGFFDDLRRQHGAPGDFAQAYVIAHEVGHHIQNLLGTSGKVQRAQQAADETVANQLSVMLELQADCYAGIWTNRAERARQILEEGDIEEALRAANAIGDDRLQKQSRGYITPDSFTHGTSEQRMRWFKRGLTTGSLESCNTFATNSL